MGHITNGHFRKLLFLILLSLCLLSPFATKNTFATLEQKYRNLYSANSILFYNPNEPETIAEESNIHDNCTPITNELGETSIVSSAANLSQDQIAFVQRWYSTAQQLSVEYGLPWETVVAQGILESGAGTTQIARDKNNLFGIGAYDSCPYECAYSFPTIEDAWRGYYENIRKTKTYRMHGVFQGETITDPHAYLVAIKAAGYATDPNYIEKVDRIITAIEILSQENNWASSAKLAQDNPSMLAAAAIHAQGGQAAAPDSSARLSTDCSNTDVDTGSIASTAVDLAWPNSDGTCDADNSLINWSSDKSRCYSSIKPSYQEALTSLVGSQPLSYYQDCGHFVSTVIHKSGADTDFPASGTSTMLSYLSTHTDKWLPVENLGNTSNLQPGDIFVLNGHIMIYTGDVSSFGNCASASLNTRTSNMGNIYFQDGRGTYSIFRLNK